MRIYELTVTHREIRAELLQTLGRDKVRVTSAPMGLNVLALGEMSRVYHLDLTALTQAEMERLVKHLASKYAFGKTVVERRLESEGLVIPASAGTLRIREVDDADA